jgi:hypothetical protein
MGGADQGRRYQRRVTRPKQIPDTAWRGSARRRRDWPRLHILLIVQWLSALMVAGRGQTATFRLGSAANAALNNLFIGSAAAPLRFTVAAGFRLRRRAITRPCGSETRRETGNTAADNWVTPKTRAPCLRRKPARGRSGSLSPTRAGGTAQTIRVCEECMAPG